MKKVLITGGCRGIGRAIAEKFYKNGYITYATYNSDLKSAEDLKSKYPYINISHLDVTSPSSVSELFSSHNFDIVINNAGVSSSSLIHETTNDDFDRIIKVNLYGTFYVSRAAIPYMIKNQGGVIINISSIWGITGGALESAYSASKAGIIGLTKSLAKELGPSKIRVNAVAPGFTLTDMTSSISEEDKVNFFSETPLLRGATPEEIASSVYFLASEEASFITGQVLSPNGGYVI